MSNEVVNIADIIRQRLQADFMTLLPEESFKLMTDKAIAEFTQPKMRHLGSGRQIMMSDAEFLVYQELERSFVAKLKASVNSPEFNSFVDGRLKVPDLVAELITQHGDKLVAALFGGLIAQVMQNFRYMQS